MLEAIDLIQFIDSGFFSPRLKDGSSFLDNTSFVIVSALSYNRPLSSFAGPTACPADQRKPLTDEHFPSGCIAPFTRANFYKTHERGIRTLLKEAGLSRKQFKTSINGLIREKAYAMESGFALPGKNSILLTPELGSTFVLAITKIQEDGRQAMLNLNKKLFGNASDFASSPELRRSQILSSAKGIRSPMEQTLCNNCGLCETQCPTSAINNGKVDCYTCLQSLSGKHIPLDVSTMKVWGKRFYGCSTCQDVCPVNSSATMMNEKIQVKSPVGEKVNLLEILSLSNEEIKDRFKGNQIGASWVSPMALKRNSLLALGNPEGQVDSRTFVRILETLRRYSQDADPVLSSSAKHSLKKLLNR